MTDDNENELRDPAPLRDAINKKVGELFEFNQKVVAVLREQAHDFEKIAGFFDVQRQRCFEIAGLIVELSALAAANTSNIIIAEFGHSDDTGLLDLSGEPEEIEEEGDNS